MTPAATAAVPRASRAAASGLSNVTVDSHTGGLLVDHCRRVGIDVVIRGVRGVADLARISSTLVTAIGQQDRVTNEGSSTLLPAGEGGSGGS